MANRTKKTPARVKKFLEALRTGSNISQAAAAAKVARSTVFSWGEEDEEFKTDWEDAYAEGTDVLESKGWKRAVDGVLEPIYQGGQHVGDKLRYSDTVYTFLMKARDPDRYRERVDVNANVNLNIGEKMAEAEARIKKLKEKK